MAARDVASGDDSDAALMRRAAEGDEHAFSVLMRRHKDAVYRVARRRLGDADEAYDIVQQAFVSAWRSADRYDPSRSLSAWLFRITVNACRDRLRRRAVRAFFFHAAPLDGPDAVQVADERSVPADAQTESRQELARAEAAIAALPDGLKEAFLLFAVEGLSQKETADALGISAKAVELRVARARQQIKAALGIEGRPPGDRR